MLCPFCGRDNIPGIDLCEDCGADLAGLDIPEARRGLPGRLMTDRVGDLDLSPALVLEPADSVGDAIRVMRREKHGCVLVHEGERLVGIFTERDVLARVVCPGRDPDETRLAEVMTPSPTYLRPLDPPAYAIHLTVSRGMRHLPIVEEGKTRGFISVRNLLRYLNREIPGATA